MLKRKINKIKKLCRIAVLANRTVPFYRKNFCSVFFNAVRLCGREGFTPQEAFTYGLFTPNLPEGTLNRYISRRKMLKIHKSVNPVSWAPLLKNKGMFWQYCMALGIPVPKLYAIFFKKTPGWSSNNNRLITRDDWKRFFDKEVADEFVIKPVTGSCGKSVNIFRKIENGFIDAFGKSCDSGQLFDALSSDDESDSFLIQQRIINHPELRRLSGTDYLQTVRFMTFIGEDGKCSILATYCKIINDENIIDNFHSGQTGNFQVPICQTDGKLESAMRTNVDGSYVSNIPVHPKTGIAINGFTMPMWEQTCNLIKQTAPKFLPIRNIGWDAAITPNGPVILEGNIWYGQPSGLVDFRLFLKPFVKFSEKIPLPSRFFN